MGRSLKKGPFVDERLWKRIREQKDNGARDPLRTWSRTCTVIPDFVGHTFSVHNGRTFMRVFITEDMVGHKLGEFAPTRTFRGHVSKSERSSSVRR